VSVAAIGAISASPLGPALERTRAATDGVLEQATRARASSSAFGARALAAIEQAQQTAAAADASAEAVVRGEVDVHEALVAMEKADITIKLATTVRNKLLEAYQQLTQSAQG
jgi:flagellar hook-basal body complex protein FliE